MKIFVVITVLTVFAFTGCDKSEVKQPQQTVLPVTNAVKTGDWMVTYFEGNAMMDMGLTFIVFSTGGKLVATKDGVSHSGLWLESNTGNHKLDLNIATAEIKLQRINRVWKVTNVSEYFVDLQDNNAASNARIQLMKH